MRIGFMFEHVAVANIHQITDCWAIMLQRLCKQDMSVYGKHDANIMLCTCWFQGCCEFSANQRYKTQNIANTVKGS